VTPAPGRIARQPGWSRRDYPRHRSADSADQTADSVAGSCYLPASDGELTRYVSPGSALGDLPQPYTELVLRDLFTSESAVAAQPNRWHRLAVLATVDAPIGATTQQLSYALVDSRDGRWEVSAPIRHQRSPPARDPARN
jgi:hypothetical protein